MFTREVRVRVTNVVDLLEMALTILVIFAWKMCSLYTLYNPSFSEVVQN